MTAKFVSREGANLKGRGHYDCKIFQSREMAAKFGIERTF